MDTRSAKARELAEKEDRYVWHALSRSTPTEGDGPAPRMKVTEGSGAWISDSEGNRYLDGMSGLWCVNAGYGREELAGLEDHEHVGQIRHKGLLFGVELVEDKESRTPAAAEKVTGGVISACKKRGLIVGKIGDTVAGFNNVITLAPPLSVTDDDLRFIASALKDGIESL